MTLAGRELSHFQILDAWPDLAEEKMAAFLSGQGPAPSPRFCESCRVFGLFPNPSEVLVFQAGQLFRQNVATEGREALLGPKELALWAAALSPDGRRVAATVVRPDGMAALLFFPIAMPDPPRDTWMTIAEDRESLSRPARSADGKTIYYGSTRDNVYCLWAQRIGAAGQPEAAPAQPAAYAPVSGKHHVRLATLRGRPGESVRSADGSQGKRLDGQSRSLRRHPCSLAPCS